MGYSSWGHKESDTTEELIHTHTHTHTICCGFHNFLSLPMPFLSFLLRFLNPCVKHIASVTVLL